MKKFPNLKKINQKIREFKDSLKSFKMKINEIFQDFVKNEFTIGIWGAGCTTINIFSFLKDLKYEKIYIYDSSETKIGNYLPGLGKKIKHPNEIKENNPDVILIMSERYVDEIYEKLLEMNYSKDIWRIYPTMEKLNNKTELKLSL